jgi:hypothetical protein
MTGRGLGLCRSAWEGGAPGTGFGPSRAIGHGYGRGRGWRHCYCATGLPGWGRAGKPCFGGIGYSRRGTQDELNDLTDYIRGLEETLQATKARIVELERTPQRE